VGQPEAGSAIRVGSRGSELALRQAKEVAGRILACRPELAVEHVAIQTTGDRVLDVPLARVGGKGIFTKELDAALLDGRIDLAIHSLKDVPTGCPSGLALTTVLPREDPRDALVAAPAVTLETLPAGSRVGTSSLRRRAQLLARRPDLRVIDVRGNVATRLARLDRGDVEALVLARAGLIRLGLGGRIARVFEADELVPAAGQGALAATSRAGDERVSALLDLLDDPPTRLATRAERAFLARLEGGCQVPIGALGQWEDGVLILVGIAADVDGLSSVRGREQAPVTTDSEAERAGTRLADRLIVEGAGPLLEAARARGGPLRPESP